MKKILVLFTLIFSFPVFAISELHYERDFQQKVLPLIFSFKTNFFTGAEQSKIHYATYSSNIQANRCLIILPGRTEPLQKYAEVVHSLEEKMQGEFHFFLMDLRGQGSSQRLLTETGDYEKGHVDDFDFYVSDLRAFMDQVVAPFPCKERLLLAHSLGAGVAASFMIKYPEIFDRAALSSPMLKIQTKPYSYTVAQTIVKAQMAMGRGNYFAIGQKPFNPDLAFSENNFTSSPARFKMAMDMFKSIVPEARLGGVTNGWLNEVMKGTKKIRKHYADITIPLRVFHAGIETYSEKEEMIKFCDQAPYCVRLYLPTSKHEVLMDRDENRDQVITELVDFFR